MVKEKDIFWEDWVKEMYKEFKVCAKHDFDDFKFTKDEFKKAVEQLTTDDREVECYADLCNKIEENRGGN